MDKIKVLHVRTGEPAEVVEMEQSLDAMKALVGGWIQMTQPVLHLDSAVIVCNEEGKLGGYEPNRYLVDENLNVYDIVYGDFFVVDAPPMSEDFGSLSDAQIETYKALYDMYVV